MNYSYEPLARPDSEVRLVLLEPGAYDDNLNVSFQISTLEENPPDYEALSYVWGPSENPSVVYINDDSARVISITRNLDIALRHLRYRSKRRLIWVDALCINQQSTSEKSSQVALMGKIYSLASCVMIWVGPEERQSNDALTLLKALSSEVEVDWSSSQLRPSHQCTSVDWADVSIPLPFAAGELNSVCALFERPYFRRAWIRQEIALAKKATMYCGSQVMQWEDFQRATASIRRKKAFERAVELRQWPLFRESMILVYHLCQLRQGNIDLYSLRYAQRAADCQDPRDRIYAVLGLLSEQDRLLNIKPDYSLPAEHLFTDIARRILVDRRSLELLELCHPASNALELPSWVPDWSLNPSIYQQIQTKWSASGWISAQAYVKDNLLCAIGVAKAKVRTVTERKVGGSNDRREVALRILKQLKPAQEVLDLKGQGWQDTLRNYCLAFTNYRSDEFFSPPRDILGVEEIMQALELVWSSEADWTELQRTRWPSPLSHFLTTCYYTFLGRCLFSANDGYFGLGPADLREGDVVCVFLGCRFPIAVRPVLGAETRPLWRVVGPVILPGLMHGEAIYGHKLPDQNRPVERSGHEDEGESLIDGFAFALHDTVNKVFIDDPTVPLEEAGIKVESYRRWPHELTVLPETLRAANVALEEFALI